MADGSASCMAPGDSTVTYPMDAGAGDGGLPMGCTESMNANGCDTTCMFVMMGITSSSDIQVSTDGLTRNVSTSETTADGGILGQCSYQCTLLKQ
jgi:hypothetical protein